MNQKPTFRGQRACSRRRVLSVASLGAAGAVLTGAGGVQFLTLPKMSEQSIALAAEVTPTSVPNSATPVAGKTAAAPDFAPLFADFKPADEPNGDLAKVVWPEWMAQLDPEVKELYTFQILNGQIMRYMPCFCGCQWEDGHQNNRDCYIDTVNADGSVVFDTMAPT